MKWLLTLALALAAHPVHADDVRMIRNVPYYDGDDRDEYRHRLDVFLPVNATKFPTVVFVHGGGWAMGSKDGFLMLPGHKAADHGRFFAERGIGCVQVNYRLSPKVRHPEHAIDVARSVAWVRRHIARMGGDADNIFLMGHSAGGHLVALLGTDPKYLMAEGLTPAMFKGIIPVSGVFTLSAELGPTAGMGENQPSGAGVFFGHVFGTDKNVHRTASPINHVAGGRPPFLIAYADRDLLSLAAQGEAFFNELTKQKVPSKKLLVTGRTHQGILKSMIAPGDPLGDAVLKFIATGKPE